VKYVVRQGECALSLADRHGITLDDLLSLGDNGRLREEGRSPNILRPGETIDLPDPTPHWTAISSRSTNRYRAAVARTSLRLQLVDRSGNVLANRRYELATGPTPQTGQTDGDGWLVEEVATRATDIELRVWLRDGDREPIRMVIHPGGLDPVDDESGIVQRLANLGYGVASGDREALARAIAAFQAAERLEVNGHLDDATRSRLIERHGC
jgi:N-acetylmuramoyl-L-alanine amidase